MQHNKPTNEPRCFPFASSLYRGQNCIEHGQRQNTHIELIWKIALRIHQRAKKPYTNRKKQQKNRPGKKNKYREMQFIANAVDKNAQ